MKANGYILHEDTERVIIATGFTSKSKNIKTGSMVQIWILVKSENPLDAIKSGSSQISGGQVVPCPTYSVSHLS